MFDVSHSRPIFGFNFHIDLLVAKVQGCVTHVMAKRTPSKKATSSSLDFKSQLWAAADNMRGQIDSSKYKGTLTALLPKLRSGELRMPAAEKELASYA
jgi:hypothetical protein